jgi:hypothetical protein
VVQIKLEPSRRADAWDVSEATAWIRPLELVQGQFEGEAKVTGALSVQVREGFRGNYCGAFLRLQIAEKVLVVARGDGTYRTLTAAQVSEPDLKRLFEKYR